MDIPIIDISPYTTGTDREGVIRQVDSACREHGFLVISGHGVDPALVADTVGHAKSFFSQPTDAKQQYNAAPARGGYQKFANMSLGQSNSGGEEVPADLREAYMFERHYIEQPDSPIWGSSEEDVVRRTLLTKYFEALNALASTLLEIIAQGLGHEAHTFAPLNDENASTLALYHYPGMSSQPLPGQLRGGEHTDFGGLTLLFGHPSVHGLEVFDGSKWVEAPLAPDTFVVNIGDLLQRWTNDVYTSTLHRVANPSEGAWDQERISVVFFQTPNTDALISSLDRTAPAKYPDVFSGDYFAQKVDSMAVKS